eukprot:3931725-Prymnesium_polylepis.3
MTARFVVSLFPPSSRASGPGRTAVAPETRLCESRASAWLPVRAGPCWSVFVRVCPCRSVRFSGCPRCEVKFHRGHQREEAACPKGGDKKNTVVALIADNFGGVTPELTG